jgi:hypothetical protein
MGQLNRQQGLVGVAFLVATLSGAGCGGAGPGTDASGDHDAADGPADGAGGAPGGAARPHAKTRE